MTAGWFRLVEYLALRNVAEVEPKDARRALTPCGRGGSDSRGRGATPVASPAGQQPSP